MRQPTGHRLWKDFAKFAEQSGISLDQKEDWWDWWTCFICGVIAETDARREECSDQKY